VCSGLTLRRHVLGEGELPSSFQIMVEYVKVDKKDQASSSIMPDILPSVSFADGHVVEDVAVQTRSRNLVVGGRVTAIRGVRSVRIPW